MAVKPTDLTPIWATQLNYTTGPAALIGTATKVSPGGAEVEGWKADQKPPAQWDNFTYNFVGKYVNWVRLGSKAADLGAHIIETDSAGEAFIAKINGGGTALGDSAAVYTSNAAGACMTIADTIGSFALVVTSGSTLAGIRSTQTGTGAAIEGRLSGASATGSAVTGDAGSNGAFGVDGDGGTAGVGVSGTGGGSSSGVIGTGGATGMGMDGVGGATSGIGVRGRSLTSSSGVLGISVDGIGVEGTTDTGSNPAVSGTSSGSGSGVFGTSSGGIGLDGSTTSTSGSGVKGTTPASATNSAAAVRAVTGTGDAQAINARSDAGDGYALQVFAKASSPVRSSIRMVPQDDDPTSDFEGDLYYNDSTNSLKTRTVIGFQHVLASDEGYCHGFGLDATGAHNSSTFAEYATAGLPEPHAPKVAGTVIIAVTGQFRNSAADLNAVRVRIRDKTGAVTIATYDIKLDQRNSDTISPLASAYEKTISLIHRYTLPSAGAITFSVEIASEDSGGATGVEWANLHIEVRGVYVI